MAKVLVVDDEKRIRFSLNKILTGAGHEVALAGRLNEAKAALSTEGFEVAIVDRILSNGEDGCGLVKHIKRVQPGCETILMSAYPTFESAMAMLECETFAYLTKPVKKEALCNIVKGAQDKFREKKRLEEDKKNVEAQLLQAQKMESLGILAGGIAHDFNNILMSIMGCAEITKLRISKESKANETLDNLLKAGHRASDLVQQIAGFGRQGAEEKHPTRISLIVKEVLKLMKATLPKTIEICHENSVTNHMVLADPIKIHQILMNLCTNSYHAMRDTGGLLSIKLTEVRINSNDQASFPGMPAGQYLKLTVSDTGCGIHQQVINQIFDPFFTTKKAGEGTGLGLSVVQKIIKDHGGHITVYSEPEKGAAFNILLPVIEKRVEPEKVIEKPVPKGRESILFVDDDQAIARMGKVMLETLGYDVVTRTSSIEALKLVNNQPNRIDLVITDYDMPDMTGEELTTELLAVRSDIPAILCTGYATRLKEKKARVSGIREIIHKPFTRRDLANTVRKVLDVNQRPV